MSEANGIEVWYRVRCGHIDCRRAREVSYIGGKSMQVQARKYFVSLGWSKTKDGWRCPDHKRHPVKR